MTTVGSLFSGAGLLDLGLTMAGLDVIWHAETEPKACEVLERHWPGAPNHGDVAAVDWSTVERPDVVAGGFPCPPFSAAGRRLGRDDPRYLWPAIAECVRALRPRAVLLENVSALTAADEGRIFGEVIADLAQAGYVGKWACMRASDVGAPHRRERVLVAAYAEGHERGLVDRDAVSARVERAQRRTPPPADPERVGEHADRAVRPGVHRGGDPARRPSVPAGAPVVRAADALEDCADALADYDGPRRPRPVQEPSEGRPGTVGDGARDWGVYGPGVERWAGLTRPAPDPVDGFGRLNVELSEWMMGCPEGWMDWLSRSARLRCAGNGVVVQVGELAGRWLLEGMPA